MWTHERHFMGGWLRHHLSLQPCPTPSGAVQKGVVGSAPSQSVLSVAGPSRVPVLLGGPVTGRPSCSHPRALSDGAGQSGAFISSARRFSPVIGQNPGGKGETDPSLSP